MNASNVIPFETFERAWKPLGYVAAIVHDDGSISLVESYSAIRTNHRDACKDLRAIREIFPTMASAIVTVRGAIHRRRR